MERCAATCGKGLRELAVSLPERAENQEGEKGEHHTGGGYSLLSSCFGSVCSRCCGPHPAEASLGRANIDIVRIAAGLALGLRAGGRAGRYAG